MSTDKGSYFLYVLDCFQIRILNLHTLVIKAKHKIIIISKLTEPICVVQCPRPPAPPQLRTTRSVRDWAAACHLNNAGPGWLGVIVGTPLHLKREVSGVNN